MDAAGAPLASPATVLQYQLKLLAALQWRASTLGRRFVTISAADAESGQLAGVANVAPGMTLAEAEGHVKLGPEQAAATLSNMAVAPHFRRRGLGRILLQAAEQVRRAAGESGEACTAAHCGCWRLPAAAPRCLPPHRHRRCLPACLPRCRRRWSLSRRRRSWPWPSTRQADANVGGRACLPLVPPFPWRSPGTRRLPHGCPALPSPGSPPPAPPSILQYNDAAQCLYESAGYAVDETWIDQRWAELAERGRVGGARRQLMLKELRAQ